MRGTLGKGREKFDAWGLRGGLATHPGRLEGYTHKLLVALFSERFISPALFCNFSVPKNDSHASKATELPKLTSKVAAGKKLNFSCTAILLSLNRLISQY